MKGIKNKTTGGKIICSDVSLADSFFSRFLGLMFSLEKKNLLIKTKREGILESSIHMMFTFYPLDVVWINKKNKVVDIKKNLDPFFSRRGFIKNLFKIYKPKEKAGYVLELGKDRVEDNKINVGDKVEFVS